MFLQSAHSIVQKSVTACARESNQQLFSLLCDFHVMKLSSQYALGAFARDALRYQLHALGLVVRGAQIPRRVERVNTPATDDGDARTEFFDFGQIMRGQ